MIAFGLAFEIEDNSAAGASSAAAQVIHLKNEVDSLNSSIQTMHALGQTGRMLMDLGTNIVAPFGEAIQRSMEFNEQISKVGAISRASEGELEQLKAKAMELGAATQFTAKQVGEAQQFLAMSGFSVEESLQGINGVLATAAASGESLAKTADIAANVLRGFNIPAAEMGRVSDVIAATISSSNQNMADFAYAVKYIAPVAQNFGVTLEETAAMIGLLADKGIKGSSATSVLQTAMQSLAAPTRKASDEMARLGVHMFDEQGNFIGMIGMIKEMERVTHNMTVEEKAATLSRIFGSRASKNIMALMAAEKKLKLDGVEATYAGAEALEKYTEKLHENGVAQEMMNTMTNNLAGDMEKMNSAIDGMFISLGDSLEPIVRLVTQAFTQLVTVFDALMQSPIGRFISYLVLGIGLLATGFGALMVAMSAYRLLSIQVAANMKLLSNTMLYQAITQKGLIGGFQALGQAALRAMVPLLPYIAVGAAIGGAIYFAYRAFKEFQAVLEGSKAPATGFLGFMQKLGGIMAGVIEIFKTINSDGVFDLTAIHAQLEQLGIKDVVVSIGTYIHRFMVLGRTFMNTMGEIFTKVWGVISTVFDAIAGAFRLIGESLGLWTPELDANTSSLDSWASAGEILAYVVTGILVVAIGALTLSFASMAISVIAATWPILLIIGVITGLIYLIYNFDEVMAFLGDAFSAGWEAISEFFMSLPGMIMDALNAAMEFMFDLWSEMWQWIIATAIYAVLYLVDAIPRWIEQAFNWAVEMATRIVTEFIPWLFNKFLEFMLFMHYELPKMIIGGFIDGILWVTDKVIEFVPWLIDKFFEFLDFMINDFPGLFAEAFRSALNWAVEGLLEFGQTLYHFFFEVLPQTIYDWGASIAKWIIEGIESTWESLKSSIEEKVRSLPGGDMLLGDSGPSGPQIDRGDMADKFAKSAIEASAKSKAENSVKVVQQLAEQGKETQLNPSFTIQIGNEEIKDWFYKQMKKDDKRQ